MADIFSATPSLSPRSTPPSAIRAIPSDSEVREAVRAWTVVSARRVAGGQRRGLVGPGCRVPALRTGPTMTEDRTDKLYAGQMGIIAVLVNVLIDKGVITLSELSARFEQAHEAASRCSGGPGIAVVLEDMLTYLEAARGS
jgi:hypothetical protein